MKKNLRWLVMGASFLGLGLSMPSCPGQQAMQQQVDALQAKNNELTKQIQGMDSQVKGMSKEVGDMRTLLGEVTNAIQGQRQTLTQLEDAVKNMQSKPAAGKGAAKAPAKKKK
jgi:septal ring factor EnvC (AmiA/AmiB activator)